MTEITIGSQVKVSHPVTVLNPDEYFEVVDIKYDTGTGKCWIRGENTCWFNANMILEGTSNASSRKKYQRRLTYSGDHYRATDQLWAQYWTAVEQDNWDFVQGLEEGNDPDFFYDP